MSKKPYAEQIRIPTQKAADNAIVTKHSEFKKPYLSDTYEEMEYIADAPPGFAFAPPNLDTPWMGIPTPNFGDMYTPWHLIFNCTLTSEDCYCEGGEKCFSLSCTHEIIGINVHETGLDVSVSDPRVCVTAPEGESGSVEIDVNMRAPRPWPSPHGTSKFVYGTHYSISLPSCPTKECCSGTVTAWDSGNSDDTVTQSSSAVATITGSGTETDWTISGSGFWFDEGFSVTTLLNAGLTVTVYTDGSACGTGDIVATGCDGSTASGKIRCTDVGAWNVFFTCIDNGGGGVTHLTRVVDGLQEEMWAQCTTGTETACCDYWWNGYCPYCTTQYHNPYVRGTFEHSNWECS